MNSASDRQSRRNQIMPAAADHGRFLLYTAADGGVKVDVFLRGETVWLTQKTLAELFAVKRPAVTKHLLNIFATGELAEDSVCSILEHTAADGKTYATKYYNLDAIIAVGYRVNSYQATQFRIWATRTLREFMIKGFVLDAALPHMGLTTWRRAPDGKILKSDVAVAKNYLNEAHIRELNRIVSAYLDLAESRAERGILTTMAEWIGFLHSFLELSNYPILQDKGRVTTLEARLKAEQEYEVFRQRQDAEYISDFDREIKRLEGKP